MPSAKYPTKTTKTYLFKLSIPIFFANIAIPLVGLVDTALMGHLGNLQFLAATSIATSIISMLFWSFGFLRMGTTGLVAQALGKGDYREIVLVVIRNLSVAFLISLILISLQSPILLLINNFFITSIETQMLIKKYISIRIWSAPAELAIYVLVGFYLGLQKTKTTSFLISFFSIVNIILSYYFVVILELDIYGVALGTVLSAYITIAIFLLFTFFYIKTKFNIVPRYRKILITKKLIKLFNINFDIFIRTILLTFSFLWFTYQGSKISEDYLAVNSILLQFIALSSFFLDSYAFSTEGVVGFAIGRKIKKNWTKLSKLHNLQIDVEGIDAIPNFSFRSKNNLFYKTFISQEMLKKKILASNYIFFSVAHREKKLNKYYDCLERIFYQIKQFENEEKNVERILEGRVCISGMRNK